MNSDLSDDENSKNSRNARRRTAWLPPSGRSTNSTYQSSVAATTTNDISNNASTPHNANTQGVGLLDPTLSEARRRKLNAINKLSSLGAQRDIDLPQIVVIGSQSAGKSSLIESISGITLPRASGTCTRCPTECRLVHSSEPWQCSVSLRFMVDDLGRPLDRVRNVAFGPPIRDRKHVEDRLRRAQQAILNPTTEPESFLETSQTLPHNKLDFSTNCVSLEISGPDVTDLAFVDLPGLISSVADGGRDEDVEGVTELVSSYISKPSCIILLTVACESDFETQGAYRLAKQHDNQGMRTIGVLTKPDRIPEGEESRWVKLIKNEKSALQNGWYCVKQPSSKELEMGLPFQEARRRGEDFFARPPWSKLETIYRSRLGTKALTLKLNEFLMAVITKRIPEIMQELQMMLQQTKEELEKLPKPRTQDPVLELMHLIGDFSDDLYRTAEGFRREASGSLENDGSAANNNHFQLINKAYRTFRRSIRATAPNFRPFDHDQRVMYPNELEVEHSDANIPEVPVSVDAEYEPSFLRPEEGEIICSSQCVIYRDEVVLRVQNATTRELPGYHPFQVVQDLVSCSTNNWDEPAFFLIGAIHEMVVKHQNILIEKYFAQYSEGGLSHTVSTIMHEYTQERRQETIRLVNWLLTLEAHPFTVNKNYFSNYRGKFLDFYREKQFPYIYETENQRSLNEPWDANKSALEIMATVRAYFHVAYKRIVDVVPLAIDSELVRVHKRRVQEALSSGLKITGPDAREHCLRFLAEPAEQVSLRHDLEYRRQRLEAAQTELIGI